MWEQFWFLLDGPIFFRVEFLADFSLFGVCHLLLAFSEPMYLNPGKEERQSFLGNWANLPIIICRTLRCLCRLSGTIGQARTRETSVSHWQELILKSLAQSILVSALFTDLFSCVCAHARTRAPFSVCPLFCSNLEFLKFIWVALPIFAVSIFLY